MKVTWTPAPGRVSHYRLKYVPRGGGKEVALKVPGAAASTVVKRLQPRTTYNITVDPIYKRGEGKARQGVGTTRTLVQNQPLTDSTPQTHNASLRHQPVARRWMSARRRAALRLRLQSLSEECSVDHMIALRYLLHMLHI